jgi:hypothetical protein
VTSAGWTLFYLIAITSSRKRMLQEGRKKIMAKRDFCISLIIEECKSFLREIKSIEGGGEVDGGPK